MGSVSGVTQTARGSDISVVTCIDGGSQSCHSSREYHIQAWTKVCQDAMIGVEV